LRDRKALRVSQQVAVDRVLAHPGYMLAMDMGIGKTAAVLTALRELLDTFQVSHVLVIAPLLVAEETWPEEIETWSHTNALRFEVLTGPAHRRAQRAQRLPELSIVNLENVPWLVDHWGDAWPYDMLVIDEISKLKNPAKRTKPTKAAVQRVIDQALATVPELYITLGPFDAAVEPIILRAAKRAKSNRTRFGALCTVRRHIDRVVGMTGTLAPNGLLDLWAPYYLLDRGERLGTSYYAYRNRWFVSDYMGFKYEPRPGAFEAITDRIRDITVSMRTEDYVDMPPVVYNTLTVRLPPAVMKQYKRFARTLLWEEPDIEAVNQGVLTGKMLQLCNGSIYDADGQAHEIHALKLDVLDRVIEEAAGAPVLVAYSYQFDLVKLRKRYPRAEVVGETKDLQKRWNAGEIPVLLAHPQAAGHGLNLQYGGCITVWYGLPWSLEYYQQLNKRLRRPGQEKTVFIHHIVAVGTVDERVMQVLPEKEATQAAIHDATRHPLG